MMLPHFIICGTQKGGTTALLYYLRQHPDVYMPRREVHFFSWYWNKGLRWYKKHFRYGFRQVKFGEKSPSYMLYARKVAKRMKEVLPSPKLIFMLRDPVRRAYSSYWMYYLNGVENLPFDKAVWIEDEIRDYLKRGKYAEQIEEFLKYYDTENILILISEDFRENREERMKEVFDFIGVKQLKLEMPDIHVGGMPKSEILRKLSGVVHKVSRTVWDFPELRDFMWDLSSLIKKFNRIEGKKPPMDDETKRKLYEYYEPYNQELMNLLDDIGLNHLSKIIEEKWRDKNGRK